MVVLSIIGVIVFLAILFASIKKLDTYTDEKFGYQFFDSSNIALITIGAWLCYFGYDWYMDAVKEGSDTLNGILMMAIGTIFYLLQIFINFSSTNFKIGFFGSIFQIVVLSVASVFIFIFLLIAMAFLSETKPVINLNSKD
jgi:hypothetical protein